MFRVTSARQGKESCNFQITLQSSKTYGSSSAPIEQTDMGMLAKHKAAFPLGWPRSLVDNLRATVGSRSATFTLAAMSAIDIRSDKAIRIETQASALSFPSVCNTKTLHDRRLVDGIALGHENCKYFVKMDLLTRSLRICVWSGWVRSGSCWVRCTCSTCCPRCPWLVWRRPWWGCRACDSTGWCRAPTRADTSTPAAVVCSTRTVSYCSYSTAIHNIHSVTAEQFPSSTTNAAATVGGVTHEKGNNNDICLRYFLNLRVPGDHDCCWMNRSETMTAAQFSKAFTI